MLLPRIALLVQLSVARTVCLVLTTTKVIVRHVRLYLDVISLMVVVEKKAASNAKKVIILTKTMTAVSAVVLFQAVQSATQRQNALNVLAVCLSP